MVRAVILLLVAAALASAAWWLVSGAAPAPLASPAGEPPGVARPAPQPGVPAPGEAAAEAPRVPAESRLPALRGRVVDGGGDPVAGAAVACWRTGGELVHRAHTTAAGEFHLAVPPGGHVGRLEVRKSGYLRRRVTLDDVPLGGELDVGEVRLRRGAVLAGRVVEASGRPVAGATVYRLQPMAAARRASFEQLARQLRTGGVVTDGDGRFAFEHARTGAFCLVATHPDHPEAWLVDREIAAGAVLDDLVLVMQPGTSIRGRVVGLEQSRGDVVVLVWDLAGERPLPEPLTDVQMSFAFEDRDLMSGLPDLRRLEVGEDGAFELRGIPLGARHALWAVEQDPTLLRTWRCTPSREARAGEVGVELHYEPGANVTFAVVDAATGAPITRLRVTPRLVGGGVLGVLGGHALARPSTREHPGGRVTISGIRPRPGFSLSLDVSARGYRRHHRGDIAVPARGTLDLGTVRLQPRAR